MGDTAIYLRGPLRQGRGVKPRSEVVADKRQFSRIADLDARRICLAVEDGDPKIIAETFGKEGQEYARRLIACWNACKGIPTPDLETGNVIMEVKHGSR